MHIMHLLVLSFAVFFSFALHFNCLFVCVCLYVYLYEFALKCYVKFLLQIVLSKFDSVFFLFQPLEYERAKNHVFAFVCPAEGEWNESQQINRMFCTNKFFNGIISLRICFAWLLSTKRFLSTNEVQITRRSSSTVPYSVYIYI